jgi:hypothetical protein
MVSYYLSPMHGGRTLPCFHRDFLLIWVASLLRHSLADTKPPGCFGQRDIMHTGRAPVSHAGDSTRQDWSGESEQRTSWHRRMQPHVSAWIYLHSIVFFDRKSYLCPFLPFDANDYCVRKPVNTTLLQRFGSWRR